MGILWAMLAAGDPSAAVLNVVDTDVGKRPPVVIFFRDWHDGGMWPAGAYNTMGVGSQLRIDLDSIYARGQIPMIDWYTDQASDPNFSMKSIYLFKRHDAFLQQFFADLAQWGKPVIIRFDPEMNGTWHPAYCDLSTTFGNAGEKNAAGDFALMWKYVVDIARAQGATNAGFAFSPNYQPPSPLLTYASLLPTPIKKYASWLGFDAYNWGGSQPGAGKTQPWFTFEACMRGTGLAAGWLGDTWAELIALDPDLPLFLGEFGTDTREGTDTNAGAGTTAVWNGQKKADWFTDTFGTQIPGVGATDYSRLKLVCYFNTTDGGAAAPVSGGFTIGNGDWPMEDPTVASGKTGGGIAQTAFQGANGPGGNSYYVAGNTSGLLMPAGMRPPGPYDASPQPSKFRNAIASTAPGHITGWWVLNEPSGTLLADNSGLGHSLSLTGAAGSQYILGSQKIVPGALDLTTLFDGAVGFASAPAQPGWSVPTTGKLTVMIAFRVPNLGSGDGCLVGKANAAGTAYEWHIKTNNTGGLAWENFSLVGNNYSSAGQGSGLVNINTTYLVFGMIDQTRTPVSRIGIGAVGGAMAFANSADTLINAPAAGNGTLDIGRRGDNVKFSNSFLSHLVIWDVALTDVSMTELFNAFNRKRPIHRIRG